MITGSFAAGNSTIPTSEYQHPITINGLAENDSVAFYQVLEWVGDADDNVSGWKAVAPFDSYLTKAKLTAMFAGDNPTGLTSEIAGELARLIGSTTEPVDTETVAENGDSVTFDPSNAETKYGPGMYMAIITPDDANTVYNPVFVSANYGDDIPASFTIPPSSTYSDNSAAKKSTLKVIKTASTTEDAWDQKDDKGNSTPNTTAIGDTVTFTVDTTIPGYGDVYTNPHFVIKDSLNNLVLKKDTSGKYIISLKLPEDLQIKDDDHTVARGSETTETNEDTIYDYEIAATDDGYTVTFAPGYLKTVAVPAAVKVQYDAIVTTDAENNVNAEDNQVMIEYSHNPQDTTGSDWDVQKDTTQHYTFTLDAEGLGFVKNGSGKRTSELVKVGVDQNGEPINSTIETSSEITEGEAVKSPLAGAQFTLYVDNNGSKGDAYKPKKSDGTAGTDPLVVTTDESGRMMIKGLDAGTYWIEETKAPSGFVRDTNAHKIEIKAEMQTVDVTEYYDPVTQKWYPSLDEVPQANREKAKEKTYQTEVLKKYQIIIDGKNTSTHNFTNIASSIDVSWTEVGSSEIITSIVNTKGVELPSTGGMGTKLFYIIGLILIIGAGVLMVTRRRVDSK
jgi:LPXTG-motif cell wall-anchored protein